ncbi:MAG: T9SS type A sorting domain-containing protein [Bacteroidia bacterium]
MKRILLFAIIILSAFQNSIAQSLENKFWETDGLVNAVIKRNDQLLLGGKFSYIGPNTGSAIMFNAQNNVIYNSEVKIVGAVHALVRDEAGHVYIGGEFESMGRKNLLVLNPDGTLNSLNIPINGPVKALYMTANILLVGGSFDQVGTTQRSNCAAINTNNGQVLSLSPNPDGEVRAFAMAGAEVIFGGNFSTVMNQTRNGLASISVLSGTLQSLNNSINGTVNCLNFDSGYLYVGGSFSSVDTFTRNNFAAINMFTNTVAPINPDINGTVNAIQFNSSTIYVGGSFSSVGFETRMNIAAFEKVLGLPTNFNPSPSAEVKSLVLNNSKIFVGGDFDIIDNSGVSHFASIDLNGNLLSSPKFNQSVSAILVNSDTIVAAGNFSSFGGVARQNFAALDFNTGAITSFAPSFNDEVKSIEIYGNYIVCGGKFTSINTVNRSGFAILDTLNGDPISITSNVSGTVNKILVFGNTAFIGGNFTFVNSTARQNLAKISLVDGSLDSWTNNADGEVLNIKSYGDYLYVTGKFSQINDTLRRGIVRFNLNDISAFDLWNPMFNDDVYDVVQDKNLIYTAGAFTQVGSQLINYLAAVDTGTAEIFVDFNPIVNSACTSIEFDGDIIYTGTLNTGGLLAFHAANSSLVELNFNGEFNGIKQVKFIDDYLFVCGDYKLTNTNSRNNFSSIAMQVSTPTINASNIQFANITPISMTVYFTKGNGSRRLLVGRQGEAVTATPSDGNDYTSSPSFGLGSTIGSGNYVISNAADTFVNITGLNIGTNYYFSLYEGNGIGSYVKYNNTNVASASQSTITGYNPPTVSASSIQSKEIRTSSMKISWTKGNGSKRIVVAKQGSAVNAIPTDSTSLFASESFGNGYDLGSDNFVVYNGAGDSLELMNLQAGTTYHFAIFEYNGIDAFARVKADNPAVANFSTINFASEPTNISTDITFSEITTNSVKLNWTSGNGEARIIIASESADLMNVPLDGEVYYTDGNFNGVSYGFSSTEKVVYIGSGNNAAVTGLNPGTTYYFGIFEYNGSGFAINYLSTNSAKANVRMKVPGTPPVNPSRALMFTRASSDSLYLKWTSGLGQGRVGFVKKGGLPSAKPSNGLNYRADSRYGFGDSLADGSFAFYDGNSDQAIIVNLEPNTIYGVEIFDYNIGDFGNTYQVDSFAYGLKSTTAVSGFKKLLKTTHVNVFPNPAANELNIELELLHKGKLEISVCDLQGRIVNDFGTTSYDKGNQVIHLDLSAIENGQYLLKILHGKEFFIQPLLISK